MPTKINVTTATNPSPPAPAKPPRKSALVLKLLARAKGATLAELREPTGWQPHSTRAYLSRLRAKGITVVREQRKSGETAYRVVAGAAAVNAEVDPVADAGASADTGAASTAVAEPAAQ